MSGSKDKLHVLGKVAAAITKKLQKGLPVQEDTMWVFVGHSFAEHKVGDTFDIFIKESDQSWNHDFKIKLLKIHDEFGRTYQCIPEGYKTICLIGCEPSIPSYMKKLPTLKTWEVTEQSVYLCDHNDIDLLNGSSLEAAAFSTLSRMVVLSLRNMNRPKLTMNDVRAALPKNTPQLIIDNLFLSGALKKRGDDLVLAG